MDFTEKNEKEILDIATPIMDNLMEASANVDYEAHIRDFSLPVPEGFTKEAFQQDCKEYQSQYGTFTDRKYLGQTTNAHFVNIYGVQSYSKTESQHLAILTLSVQNNKYVVNRAFLDTWQLKG